MKKNPKHCWTLLLPSLHSSVKELPSSLCPSTWCQGTSPAPTVHALAKQRLCTVNNWNQPTYSPPGQTLTRTLKPHRGIRQITESRAWLFLANTVLPTQGDLLGTARDGGADTKGERGQRNQARSRRAQPMAALPGVRGKSQVSLPPTALTPASMAVLLASPALSGTSHSRALLWLDSS